MLKEYFKYNVYMMNIFYRQCIVRVQRRGRLFLDGMNKEGFMEEGGFEWVLKDEQDFEVFLFKVLGLIRYQLWFRNYKYLCGLCIGIWVDVFGKIDWSQFLEDFECLKLGFYCEVRRNYGLFMSGLCQYLGELGRRLGQEYS